ncbi:hypothetical protein FM037_13565 [Shewanella psychropiezotolerans]|uniref:Protein kinase domain-containing protein n=1 Tax=Shewanella psychropiezotolerans TaxID=2593655 RepID=A0ABX5WY88_9GAMM|nr:hypothetical protein FM037_13565 [Shewanella psychropiezotolerans]
MEVTHASQTPEKGSFNSRDYTFIEKIGEGGFSQVYKAIQHNTQKYVAIKFLILCGDANQDKNRRHIAHVYGEAGIGKSRLILELLERLPARRYCVAQCLPEHQNNTLYPILNLLKHQYALVGLSEIQCLSQLPR